MSFSLSCLSQECLWVLVLSLCIRFSFIFVSVSLFLSCFFFGLWSQSADMLTIHSVPCSWIFISQPFLKVYPPICRITAYATMLGQSFSTNFVPSFDPNEWCLKNCLHRGGSNSQPFSYECSALTTRPPLFAKFFCPVQFQFILLCLLFLYRVLFRYILVLVTILLIFSLSGFCRNVFLRC